VDRVKVSLSEKDKDEVCDDWIRLLTLVLEWPKDKAEAWALSNRAAMDDEDWFLHETTSWYVIWDIITDEIWTRAKRPGDMMSQIDLALERFRIKSKGDVAVEQIEAIRAEIRSIIADCM
jgi:hypothetical protein